MTNSNQVDNNRSGDEDRLQSPGRRALLRGATVAMPAILTLQSGAALARSSNLISAAGYDAKDRYGRTLCLDLNSVYPAGRRRGRKYDLGDPPYASVYQLNDRDLRVEPRMRSRRISEAEVCKSGEPAYFPASYTYGGVEWKKVQVPKGIVVSATALHSFAGKISLTNI